MSREELKKYFAELIGTAMLVFIACGTAVYSGSLVATALAFGLTLTAIIYIFGNVSGAHVNPAVSLGAFICKKMNLKDFCFYVLAQFIGAIVGGALLFAIAKLGGLNVATSMGTDHYAAASSQTNQIILSLIVEIILTFVFVLTILGVTAKSENSKIAGLIIGLTLALVHLIGIGLTGTSVNPARSLGVAIFAGGDAIQQVWLFIVAPLAGAALAALAAMHFVKKDEEPKVIKTK